MKPLKKLKDDEIYWIKQKAYRSYCEGEVGEVIEGKVEVSLVKVYDFDEEEETYLVLPMGRDVLYKIALEHIFDAVLVKNPFPDVKESND